MLDDAVTHDDDFVTHSQGFFLVVGDVDEGYAQLLVHVHQFKLHILAHLEVKCAERLVKEEHFGLVDKCPCDGDTLLLTARKRRHVSVTVVFKVNHFEGSIDFFFDFCLGIFAEKFNGFTFLVHLCAVGYDLQFKAESNVVEHVEVREKCVLLEDGVHLAEVRRGFSDVLAVEDDATAGGHFKACYHTESGGFATAGRAEECDKLTALYDKTCVFDGLFVAVCLCYVFDLNDDFIACCHRIPQICFSGVLKSGGRCNPEHNRLF